MSTPAANTTPAQREADARGIQFHYDLPPAFFQLFLDPTMCYSCHYFLTAEDSLAEAAINKWELAARKIGLARDDRVLDVGVGWGSFVLWAASQHGCRTTGITLSQIQADYVRANAEALGVADLVDVQVMHANAMTFPEGSFDKIVSFDTIEHIADLDGLFRDCRRLLRNDARSCMLVQGSMAPATARADTHQPHVSGEASFIREYIFPVGEHPELGNVIRSLEAGGFEVVDVENLTDHYTRTLQHWYRNFMKHVGDLGAATGVSPERFRAHVLFLAGSVEGLSENQILCYQTLVRPIDVYQPRRELPATRRGLLLDCHVANQPGGDP